MTATPAPGAPALLALLDRLETLALETTWDTGIWHQAAELVDEFGEADAAFIAACRPSTILALLTAARRGAEAERVVADFRNAACLTELLGEDADDCTCMGCQARAFFANHPDRPTP